MPTQNHEVFISYSWDSDAHIRSVLSLANSLRVAGIDAWADKFEHGSPSVGWPQWCYEQIDGAQYVLVACTATYHRRVMRRDEPRTGRGASWEGMILTNEVYAHTGGQNKFIPIVFADSDKEFVPYFLRGQSVYDVSDRVSLGDLYGRLTGQRTIVPEPVGQRVTLPRTVLETPVRIGHRGPSAPEPGVWPEALPHPTTPPARLDQLVEGQWIVDVHGGMYGTMTMHLKLSRSVLGRRRFNVTSVAGPSTMPGWHGSGEWAVIAPGNRVAFRGMQRAGYQAAHLMESFTLAVISKDHLEGTNAAGMQAVWHRQ